MRGAASRVTVIGSLPAATRRSIGSRRTSLGTRFVAAVGVATVLLGACQVPAANRAPSPVMTEAPPDAPYARSASASVSVEADACRVTLGSGEEHTSEPVALRVAARDLSLRGTTEFDARTLPTEVRCWYEELWSVITDERLARVTTERAASDNLYTYARALQTHVVALLTALRVTGDLALLDEVDRLAQHMRAALDDSWRGRARSDRGGSDGYLNWVWRGSDSRQYAGRDIHATDEMRTHALVAEMAYAFAINADLASPNGVDYGERAEFWQTYLVDHFEAKWRERNDVAWPRFPFLSRPHMHESTTFVRYHHYMSLLTGKSAYAQEARRLSRIVLDNMREAPTPTGPALVWPRSVLSEGGKEDYLMPTTYGRYVMADAVDLFLEGFDDWGDVGVPAAMARTLTQFVMDDGTDSFARDIGGGVARAGIAPSARSWARFTDQKYVISPYVLVAAWDDGTKIVDVSRAVYATRSSSQRDVFIPVGLLLASALEPADR